MRPPLFANGGVEWTTVHLGMARALFSFTLGTLVADRLLARSALPTITMVPLLAVLGAVLLESSVTAA